MKSLFLIANIAGGRIALESARVESVVHIQDVISVPKSDPLVAGLFALRSRVLTLIDSQYLVTGIPQVAQKGALAVIADIGGHAFGLLVDSVEDVVAIDPDVIDSTIKPGLEWQSMVTGIAVVDGKLTMIIDPVQIVGGAQLLAT